MAELDDCGPEFIDENGQSIDPDSMVALQQMKQLYFGIYDIVPVVFADAFDGDSFYVNEIDIMPIRPMVGGEVVVYEQGVGSVDHAIADVVGVTDTGWVVTLSSAITTTTPS